MVSHMEQGIVFNNQQGNELVGIWHEPANVAHPHKAVLIVVGGPQTRVGSHRQFLLLARALANAGIRSFRFDYHGMGDSSGPSGHFENVQSDIRTAIDRIQQQSPETTEVIIWGLCDAASAAMFYGHSDARVSGMILLNPWARTDAGIAKAYLKNYYLSRLKDPELWRKIRSGKFNAAAATKSLFNMVSSATGLKRTAKTDENADSAEPRSPTNDELKQHCQIDAALPDRMADGLERYNGKVLFIISGDDLTAAEFTALWGTDRRWRKLMKRKKPEIYRLDDANHTFSSQLWRDQVANWTTNWIQSW